MEMKLKRFCKEISLDSTGCSKVLEGLFSVRLVVMFRLFAVVYVTFPLLGVAGVIVFSSYFAKAFSFL